MRNYFIFLFFSQLQCSCDESSDDMKATYTKAEESESDHEEKTGLDGIILLYRKLNQSFRI